MCLCQDAHYTVVRILAQTVASKFVAHLLAHVLASRFVAHFWCLWPCVSYREKVPMIEKQKARYKGLDLPFLG